MKRISLLVLLGIPATLPAQSTTFSSFVAADGAVEGLPVLFGATVAREGRHLGLRWGSAVDARSTMGGSRPKEWAAPSGVLMTDLDAVLFPLGARTSLPISPYAVAGIGVRLTRDSYGSSPYALWSYGLGVRTPVSPRISMDGEARHRSPFTGGDAVMPAGTGPGWEARLGLNLRIGRSGERAAPRPGAAPVPRPPRVRVPSAGDRSTEAARLRIAGRALRSAEGHLGVLYRWGGNTPQEGFDCSGFVRYVFREQGITLPRVSGDQARVGTPLPLELRYFEPGDLLAFASDGRVVDHIAIYAGEGKIIHSSASGGGVRYDDLTSPRGDWYLRHMIAARRVIDPFGAAALSGSR